MKKIFTILCFFVFGLQSISAQQEAHIKGTVTDMDTKEPLTGATVKVDKAKGALTDASGQFSVTLPAGEHDISISFVGYKNDKRHITLKADETLKLDVELNSSALQMNQVVTVSQYGKNSAQETVTTEVVSRAEIQNTNAQNVGDVVSKVPGVLVQDGQITIRGLSSYSYGVGTRTALLVDGLSLSSPDLQQTQNNFVPLENVKQVEVVKGASSVIYGSNALDGVVNIISQWPTDNDPKTEVETNLGVYSAPKLSYQKWWNTALPGFATVNVNHQRRYKNLQVICGGNITAINSYLQDNNDYRVRLFFRLRYIHPKIAGLSFGVSGSTMLDRVDQFFISKNLDTAAYQCAQSSSSAYQLTTFDPFLTYATLKGHQYKLLLRYMNIFRNGNGSDPNAVSHYIELQNQYQYRYLKDLLVFTTGMPMDIGVERSNLYTGLHDNYNWALYGQAEVNYKIMTIQAGLRYELAGVDTYFIKSKPVFRSGINLHVAAATWLRASWGQGYRIPSVAEKYLAQDFTGSVVIIPNDTLKAESSWSFELGIQQGFLIKKNWKLFIDAAAFWSQFSNYIEYVVGLYKNVDSHGNQIFPDSLESTFEPGYVLGPKPLNIENARVAGYEISLKSDGKIGPVGIKMLAGYTYNYPHTLGGQSNAGYTVGDYIHELFKYNFQRIPASEDINILPLAVRHLVHGDVELSYWKMYVGTTINYYSIPDEVPPLFDLVAATVFGSDHTNDLNNYIQQHKHGDVVADVRTGIKFNEHFSMGFIIKNVANLFYELRPGLAEPTRNYTVQFRYNF